jgi:hypothetical protein
LSPFKVDEQLPVPSRIHAIDPPDLVNASHCWGDQDINKHAEYDPPRTFFRVIEITFAGVRHRA